MTTTYVHLRTEYEIEACKRDAAKRAQGCNECSMTEDEVNAYERDQFYAAVAAKNEHDYKLAAKIERRAELDAEIPALEAEIAAAKTEHTDEVLVVKDAEIIALIALMAENGLMGLMAEIAAAKTKRNITLVVMDAEIAALEAEIAAAKTKRNNKLAAMDAEISALEAEIAAHR